jgi:hypothetical protein
MYVGDLTLNSHTFQSGPHRRQAREKQDTDTALLSLNSLLFRAPLYTKYIFLNCINIHIKLYNLRILYYRMCICLYYDLFQSLKYDVLNS